MPKELTTDSRTNVSTIGEDLTIDGNVSSTGELHINGRVKGDVHCASVVLGENSEIEGNVTAEDVMIRGRLIGSVRGRRVILQSTAHVEGDVLHKDLAMEQGAHFEGESRRSEDPLSAAREPPQRQSAEKSKRERSEGPTDKSSSIFVRTLQETESI
jgi:cytoskeletal protein CcmA (bactofilin family)